jgi:hypothetical protein
VHRARLIVKDIDPAVADLQDINVAGEGCGPRQWHVETERVLQVSDICWGEIHRHFHGHGDGVRQEHEALELVVPTRVMGDGLERRVSNTQRQVLFSTISTQSRSKALPLRRHGALPGRHVDSSAAI